MTATATQDYHWPDTTNEQLAELLALVKEVRSDLVNSLNRIAVAIETK